MSGPVRLAAWALGLATALWMLHLTGAGDLAPPPLDPTAWGPWIGTVGADAAIVAILRTVAIGLCWYLALATVVGSLAHRAGAPNTVALANRALPGFLRKLLGASATGLTLTAAGLTATVGPLLAPGELNAVGPLEAAAASDRAPAGSDQDAVATTTLRETTGTAQDPWGESANPPTATLAPFVFALAPLDALVPADPAPSLTGPGTWLASPGDHLWSIAAETLADELDDEPTERQVTAYWLEVVETNRDRLVDPANPDLILPGQEFVLPPVRADG